MSSIAVYANRRTGREGIVAQAMLEGLKRHGISSRIYGASRGRRADIGIAYGWRHRVLLEKHENYILFDLGFWGRVPTVGPKREGAYRLAVNSWDTATHMRLNMPDDRWRAAGIEIHPWRTETPGGEIIIAGQSVKSSRAHGLIPGKFEAQLVLQCRKLAPGYPVTIRAKPTGDRRGVVPIETALARTHAVVTHHSNVAVDALIAGVPSYSKIGIGTLWADIHALNRLRWGYDMDNRTREQLLSDVAYAQWTPAEMRRGEVWEYIKCVLN